MSRLSVIIPVYNERETIKQVIDRFESLDLEDYELIIVDDGSTDGTTKLLREIAPANAVLIIKPENGGKTSAVREGIAVAKREWVLVQDADLEYDPDDIKRILEHAIEHSAPVVYGKRPSYWGKPSRWVFASGVLLIDFAMFCLYRRWVRDHATCYKLVPRHLLESFDLESTGFEGCVEITAKLMRSNVPIRQIPISYTPRRSSEGKKLTASYGFTALKAAWHWRRWKPAPVAETEVLPAVAADPEPEAAPAEKTAETAH